MSSFPQAYAKVQWAEHHIERLGRYCTRLTQDAFEVVWEVDPLASPPCLIYAVKPDLDFPIRKFVYRPIHNIPWTIAMVVGDIIHSLRAALDYAATAVVRRSGISTSFVTFPFHEEREKLSITQSSGLKAIQSALPKADVQKFFQDVIRSYRTGNFHLWAITKLDKIDKHNMLIPNVSITSLRFSGRIENNTISNLSCALDAGHEHTLIITNRTDSDPLMQIEAAIQLSFRHGQFFSGQDIIPTLTDLCHVTLEALRKFDDFVIQVQT